MRTFFRAAAAAVGVLFARRGVIGDGVHGRIIIERRQAARQLRDRAS